MAVTDRVINDHDTQSN